MYQQLSQTGNKLSICLISWVDWEDYCTGRMQMILLVINTDTELSPAPHKCPGSWWMWLFWSRTDPSQLIPVSLLRTGSWIVPWDMDVKLSMIYAVFSINFIFILWTITTTTQLYFVSCRFRELFVFPGRGTFEFLMILEALNFVLVYWLTPN